MKIKKSTYRISFYVLLAITLVCGYLFFQVNVNSDMTKYLPDDSQMKRGITILSEDFSGAQMMLPDVKIMVGSISDEQRDAVAASLRENYPEVESVSVKVSEDGMHTLYELVVPKSVDQKTLGAQIRKDLGMESIVETSQDGATPPFSVIVIAACLILIVLVVMSRSWIEPVPLMLTTGMAVLINIGTNAFLESVSITTNYIGAILQLVLSLDYSIILMNRYRQEKQQGLSPLESINNAVPKAAPSILSSALTTVVGLLMLCFMKLKIGQDMGVVLAKGVVCSLVCNFTVFPALIMAFDRAIESTPKKFFSLPTDALARFSVRFKIPLVIFFILLFTASFILHNRTEISFSTNGKSRIAEVFPIKNTVVLLYNNNDEDMIPALADSIEAIGGVESVISYPSLLQKEYTVSQLDEAIKGMSSKVGEAMPASSDAMAMMTPEVMRLLYYMDNADASAIKLSFPELAEFIRDECAGNPLVDSMLDDDMRSKLSLLTSVLAIGEVSDPEPVAETETVSEEDVPTKEPEPVSISDETPSHPVETVVIPAPTADGISVIEFGRALYARDKSKEAEMLYELVDTVMIHKPMTINEMTVFMNSTPFQTKMVYSFSKSKNLMTPMQFVHFLSEDLFNRKALAPMVNESQKTGLRLRLRLMEYANADARLSAAQLSEIATGFGVVGMSEDAVRALMTPAASTPVADMQTPAASTPVADMQTPEVDDVVVAADTSAAAQSVASDSIAVAVPEPRPAPVHVKTAEERRQEFFMDLMYSGRKYTAAQMARNFERLGEKIDPEYVNLLYAFWGSIHNYDDSWTMTFGGLLDLVSGRIINNPLFASYIDDNTRKSFGEMTSALGEADKMLRGKNYSLAAIVSDFPDESHETYAFIDRLNELCSSTLHNDYYTVGESVMFSEMKNGFNREMLIVTLLTVFSIFLIVAISFRSLFVPTVLVMTVLTGVYVNVVFCGIGGGTMLYLAYLIVQSILMGATIDYGILFTNYYKEKRRTMGIDEAVKEAYRGSRHTITTSGLIMTLAPGVMSLLVDDVAISSIVGCLSIGALAAIILILFVLPGLLSAFDRLVVKK